MVEGECIHIEILIPKTAISSQKAALRESNFKRYECWRKVYTHSASFSLGCFEILIPKTAQKGRFGNQIFEPERSEMAVYGNQISKRYGKENVYT